MSDDDLDRLRTALHVATPQPDPRAKAAALALARKSFDDAQGSATEARPSRESPEVGGFMTGVKRMFAKLTMRPVLAAAAGVAVAGVAVVVALPQLPGSRIATVDGSDASRTVRTVTVRPDGTLADSEGYPIGANGPEAETGATHAEPVPLPAPPAPPETTEAARVRTAIVRQDGSLSADADAVRRPEAVAAMPPAAGETATAAIHDRSSARVSTEAPAAPPPPAGIAGADEKRTILAVPPEPLAGERFAEAVPNDLKVTAEEPVSTFSIDVDTASYAFVRAALMGGVLPPSEAVRIEEMINYFPYDYAGPGEGDGPFAASVDVLDTPWNPDTDLVRIAVQGDMPAIDDRPPLDLVFLIDTSGSMQDANKLPLLKQSFRLLLAKLDADDRVAIVTYAGSAGTVLEPTPA